MPTLTSWSVGAESRTQIVGPWRRDSSFHSMSSTESVGVAALAGDARRNSATSSVATATAARVDVERIGPLIRRRSRLELAHHLGHELAGLGGVLANLGPSFPE